jgi:Ca2+-binding EF-hand superfamily protein
LAKVNQQKKVFDTSNTNKDGVVSLEELLTGLEKQFGAELSQTRVKELMMAFDASGDNLL